MASLLRQQREKGGMIDPSREDDTIDETWVRSVGVELYERLVLGKNVMHGSETLIPSFIRCEKDV